MAKQIDCSSSPSGEILQAFGEFNRGDWYDCHETLEDLWIGSEDEPRWLYQGMLEGADQRATMNSSISIRSCTRCIPSFSNSLPEP